MKTKVMTIFGTRPEVIKLAPVIEELHKYNEFFEPITLTTGQHREMLQQILDVFGIKPDFNLKLMKENQTLSYLTSKAVEKLSDLINKVKPDYILVQGDTTTAMVAALVGFYHKIPVGHVEAGLRTYNRYSPFPEEMNRRLIGVLALHHFAPTRNAMSALLKEGVDKKQIFLTGNTVVDALLKIVNSGQLRNFDFLNPSRKLVLVTAHRRENWGRGIKNICEALKKIIGMYKDIEIVYPVHLNPNVRNTVFRILDNTERIYLIDPVNYIELISLMKLSYLILTDSGGIQEEAPVLGKPVLVMRDSTERPEGIEAGVARLVGTDPYKIVSSVTELIENEDAYKAMAQAKSPYGDGKAAQRIVNIIAEYFKSSNFLRI